MMRVAIFGLSKSGTTALFYKLREAMPPNTDCYFEPQSKDVRRYRKRCVLQAVGLRRRRSQLAKFLPFNPGSLRFVAPFGDFDHAVHIVRDPRDRLVSLLLYSIFNERPLHNESAAQAFVDRIAAKECDPKAIALIDLFGDLETLKGTQFSSDSMIARYFHQSISNPMAFADSRHDLIEFRYENLILHDFAEIERATRLVLRGQAEVGPQFQRVVRSKAIGDWRNWFTERDVDLFRPVMQPYLDRFYPQADWELSPEPRIEPVHGSGYVRRLVNEARALTGQPPLFAGVR
jgi:hypothetical protein